MEYWEGEIANTLRALAANSFQTGVSTQISPKQYCVDWIYIKEELLILLERQVEPLQNSVAKLHYIMVKKFTLKLFPCKIPFLMKF